jgi:hypothetical protein
MNLEVDVIPVSDVERSNFWALPENVRIALNLVLGSHRTLPGNH